MEKIIIVINGRGGCGKDTLCDIAAKHFGVRNVSSITPIKEIAKIAGWQGTKEPKDRKMLADLKAIFTEYNDYPTRYILEEASKFASSADEQIMFVHIREGSEIAKFVAKSKDICRTVSLLVKRDTKDYENTALGNSSDDNVNDYDYTYTFVNDAESLSELEDKFLSFLKTCIL